MENVKGPEVHAGHIAFLKGLQAEMQSMIAPLRVDRSPAAQQARKEMHLMNHLVAELEDYKERRVRAAARAALQSTEVHP